MPEKEVPQAQPVTLTMEQLRTILEDIKRPYVDPEVEARLQRARARIRAQREQSEGERKAREAACPHVRRDGTSTVAWLTTPASDGITPFTRGVCQRCIKLFLPGDPDFARMIAVPTGGEDVVY